MGFFDAHPEFFLSSTTGATPNRLNRRYEAIIDWNRLALRGARVLDIASHDGRWSFAALDAGAAYVLGVEARSRLTEWAKRNLAPCESGRWDIITGDVWQALPQLSPRRFDVVLCLGFFYHTTEHMRLLGEIKRLMPRWLVIDGLISSLPGRVIELREERTSDEAASTDTFATGQDSTLVGVPTREALEEMLRAFRFDFEYFDWQSRGITNWKDIEDYERRTRVTLRCRNPI
jgi:SAM-dependent methyltransferase